MKNAKKLVIALLLVAVIASVAIFTVLANTSVYTGNVLKFNQLVQRVENIDINNPDLSEDEIAALELAEREDKLKNVQVYLDTYPVDPTEVNEQYGISYVDIFARYRAQLLIVANTYLDKAESATTPLDKSSNIGKASSWLEIAFPTDADKELDEYKALSETMNSANLSLALDYAKEIALGDLDSEDANTFLAAGAKIKQLKGFVDTHTFNTDSAEYEAMYEAMTVAYDAYAEKVEAKRQELIWQAKLDEYNGLIGFKTEFNAGQTVPGVKNNEGTNSQGQKVINDTVRETQVIGTNIDGTPILNTYYTVRYNISAQTYLNPTYSGADQGMVFEFDLTTFDKLPSGGMIFQPYSGSTWMEISAAGTLTATRSDGSKITVKDAIVPGAWTQFTFIYNFIDKSKCQLYLDYNFLGYVDGDTGDKGTTPGALRIGNRTSASGEFSIDNMHFYVGSSIRDESYIKSMDEVQQLIYYTEYMQYTGKTPETTKHFIEAPDCIMAYNEAKKLIGRYVVVDEDGNVSVDEDGNIQYANLSGFAPDIKEKIEAAVERFATYDYRTILNEYKKINLDSFYALAKELETLMNETYAHSRWVSALQSKVTQVNAFVQTYTSYILDDGVPPENEDELVDWVPGTKYGEANTIIEQATAHITNMTNIYNYMLAMDEVATTKSLAMLEMKFAEAEALLVEISNVQYYADYYADEVGVVSWKDGSTTYEFDFGKLKHYLEVVRPSVPNIESSIESTQRSKQIVSTVEFLFEKFPNDADWKLTFVDKPETELTDAEKANNELYRYIEDYVAMIRSYVVAGDYDPNYYDSNNVSIKNAIERYNMINEHYYGFLQDKQAAVITEQLDRCSAESAGVAKEGILAYIQRYIVDNEVDYYAKYTCPYCGEKTGKLPNLTHPVCIDCGAQLDDVKLYSDHALLSVALQRYNAYIAELPPQKEGYADVLVQNTQYFINQVTLFDTVLTYVEKKALYDEATAYFYEMNVIGEDAEAAIERYNAMAAELAIVENASKSFKDTVLMFEVAKTLEDKDGYFKYVVEASIYRENIDVSIEGVAAALAEFDAAIDAYDSKVDSANGEIAECGDALGSLRYNCGLSAIISVIIEKLFSFR